MYQIRSFLTGKGESMLTAGGHRMEMPAIRLTKRIVWNYYMNGLPIGMMLPSLNLSRDKQQRNE